MRSLLLIAGFALTVAASHASVRPRKPWLGVHFLINSEADLDTLARQVPDLAKVGVNTIIVETDYNYQFKSRPEMYDAEGVTFQGARAFSEACRANHIRPIPEINCLGHQSWAQTTEALLKVHPELDETPGLFPNNKGIYCRSWCPLNPDLPGIVFPLVDELIDAFQADAFHVGMDEVFIIGADTCPRCHGKDPGELFAKSVNDFHAHLRKKRVQMFMWADRLLDSKAIDSSEWEGVANGTWTAIDRVPKDIVMCDWHYERRDDYPSLKLLSDKGFQVWPSTFKDVGAATAFSNGGRALKGKKCVGVLSTTWGDVKIDGIAAWPPLAAALLPWQKNPLEK